MAATPESIRVARFPRTVAYTAVAAGAGAVLALADPAKSSLLPPCPFQTVTGLYCPGCGTLRGLHQLLTGDPMGAVGYNPLMVATLVILVGLLLASWARVLGIVKRPAPPLPVAVPWIVFAVVVTFGVLRNIPVEPFSALAP